MQILNNNDNDIERTTNLLCELEEIEASPDAANKFWLCRYGSEEVIGPSDCKALLHEAGLTILKKDLITFIAKVKNYKSKKQVDFDSKSSKTLLTMSDWKKIYGKSLP